MGSREKSSAAKLFILEPARGLLRQINHLHQDSTTCTKAQQLTKDEASNVCWFASGILKDCTWNPASNARPVENGTRPRSTNPLDAVRATSKTARSAASRTYCASNTITPRANSSLP